MKIAFVTTFCPHYRVKTFETLARYHDVDFYFFSAGGEWYWQQQHGVQTGNFHYEYLPGFHVGRTRVTPSLLKKLWRGDYDLFVKCINGRFALPAVHLVARLKRKPFVLWTGVWMRLQTPAHRLFFPFTRFFYRHADAIAVYGEHVKRYLVGEGVPAERIFVAAHAIDNEIYNRQVSEEEKLHLRRQLGIAPEKKVVLYLGRLEESKGLVYLLKAFASLQRDDVILVLAGTGSSRPLLEQVAHEDGVADSVCFPGYISSEKTVPFYAIAWVYVLPSITLPEGKEPWGLVVNEALNQGLPVIATDAVGAAAGGLVQDGINGILVPERDRSTLAQALQCILDTPGLRQRMGCQAQQIIADWDNERMVLGFRQAIDYVA